MAGWKHSLKEKDKATWDGELCAKKFCGDGSALTNITASASDDWTVTPTQIYPKISSLALVASAALISGNVGIGTTTPEGKLHVMTTEGIAMTADTQADDLIVENNTHTGISILAADAANANLYFGSPSDVTGAQFTWHHNNNLFAIGTKHAGASVQIFSGNSFEAARIEAGGNVGIGTTNPGVKLEVNGTASAAAVLVGGVDVGTHMSSQAIHFTSGALWTAVDLNTAKVTYDDADLVASTVASCALNTTHRGDSSDPHGATLTQTNLLSSGTVSGGLIVTTTDYTASGAAMCRNILIGTEATPPTASSVTQGTLYVQYTA